MKLKVGLSGRNDCVDIKAFDMGKKAASAGRNIESCPLEKDDGRYDAWIEGYRSWRCKNTLDLFEKAEQMEDKKKPGRPRIHAKEEITKVRKDWDANYKAKKKRIDVLVDPSIHERWQTFLDQSGLKREAAIDQLLENSGY